MKLEKLKAVVVITALFLAAWPAHGASKTPWFEGHGDLGVNFSNGAWHWYVEQGQVVDAVVISLQDITRKEIPDLPAFSFLGIVGAVSGARGLRPRHLADDPGLLP